MYRILLVAAFIAGLIAPAFAQKAEIEAVNAKWVDFFNKGSIPIKDVSFDGSPTLAMGKAFDHAGVSLDRFGTLITARELIAKRIYRSRQKWRSVSRPGSISNR